MGVSKTSRLQGSQNLRPQTEGNRHETQVQPGFSLWYCSVSNLLFKFFLPHLHSPTFPSGYLEARGGEHYLPVDEGELISFGSLSFVQKDLIVLIRPVLEALTSPHLTSCLINHNNLQAHSMKNISEQDLIFHLISGAGAVSMYPYRAQLNRFICTSVSRQTGRLAVGSHFRMDTDQHMYPSSLSSFLSYCPTSLSGFPSH